MNYIIFVGKKGVTHIFFFQNFVVDGLFKTFLDHPSILRIAQIIRQPQKKGKRKYGLPLFSPQN